MSTEETIFIVFGETTSFGCCNEFKTFILNNQQALTGKILYFDLSCVFNKKKIEKKIIDKTKVGILGKRMDTGTREKLSLNYLQKLIDGYPNIHTFPAIFEVSQRDLEVVRGPDQLDIHIVTLVLTPHITRFLNKHKVNSSKRKESYQ